MAEIVGIFAASHAPPLVRDWDAIDESRRRGLDNAFVTLGRAIEESNADAIIVVGADHWASFFLENMPAICIGVGAKHDGPPEPWLAAYPHDAMAGHPELAMHLAEYAFVHRFEPSLSYRMRLDHAFCIPMWKARLSLLPPIVPVVINAVQDPVPSIERCWEFGGVIADAVACFGSSLRVAILATGGLSHSVGEPTMGEIDEAFDRGCIARFACGDPADLIDYLHEDRIAQAGNGASEVRFWMVAHGAARGRGFELMHYEAVPEAYTGCGFARWRPSN